MFGHRANIELYFDDLEAQGKEIPKRGNNAEDNQTELKNEDMIVDVTITLRFNLQKETGLQLCKNFVQSIGFFNPIPPSQQDVDGFEAPVLCVVYSVGG